MVERETSSWSDSAGTCGGPLRKTKPGRLLLLVLIALVGVVCSGVSAATVSAGAGKDIQGALNGAHCGDTIVLQAGATYSLPNGLVLPYKGPCTGTDADYITVTTSGADSLPAERLDPAQAAPAMAKLVSTGNQAIVSTGVLAHHYKFIGIDFTSDGSQFVPSLIHLGGDTTYTQRESMKGFVFDRCFVHPAEISASNLTSSSSVRTSERGMQLNVADGWVINSYVAGFTGYYPTGGIMASEDVMMDGGPGPLHIINNYLEAWYSSVFLGGSDAPAVPRHTATVSNATNIGTATLSAVADLQIGDLIAFKIGEPSPWGVGKVIGVQGNVVNYTVENATYQTFNRVPLSPGQAQWNGDVLHDVEIRGNTIVKRPEWDGYSQPKNWIEVKAGRRVTIEGNLMTSGTPTNMTFTVRNQNGSSPWIEISGLTFRYNKLVNFKNPGFGILLQDNEKVTGQSGGLIIENNLMTASSADSRAFLTHGGHDVTFSHNTILNTSSLGDGEGVPTRNLTLIDNIVNNGQYGLNCFISDGARSTCWPGLLIRTNVIVDNQNVGGLSSIYPSGNFFPTSGAAVGWVDPTSDNYSLSASSPYKGKASDGTDPGVDMNGLVAALGGTTPPPTSTLRSEPASSALSTPASSTLSTSSPASTPPPSPTRN